jgi:DDE superfamily endonuclease
MNSSAQPLNSLRAFRDALYRCFEQRADAFFELTDALLTAGPVPSPPHLSFQAVHRRGWSSLYAALSMGRADEAGLQDLLSRHPLEGGEPGYPPIYAVDVSVWPRCDAETSPERGYYYHPSRHSAGQPIVAGWAYQLVAQLGFERDSWVAPVDARRVKPAENTDEVAAAQVRALVQRLPEPEALPIFVFDAGYDPVKLQRALEGCPVRILVRLHSNRVFYASPEEVEPRPVGRPPRMEHLGEYRAGSGDPRSQ